MTSALKPCYAHFYDPPRTDPVPHTSDTDVDPEEACTLAREGTCRWAATAYCREQCQALTAALGANEGERRYDV